MYFLFDKLTATLVAASVLLVLVTIQKNMTESNIQQTISYTMKAQALNLGRWLQADLMTVGQNMDDQTIYLGGVDSTDGAGVKFNFFYDDGSPQHVIYTVSATGDSSAVNDSTRVPLYELVRERGLVGAEVEEGKSRPTLTSFQIVYLDAAGAPTLSNADARSIRVRFSAAVPIEVEGQYLRETHWATTVPLP